MSFDIGLPFNWIRSVTLNKCGELKKPVFTFKLRKTDSTKAQVEPCEKQKKKTKQFSI